MEIKFLGTGTSQGVPMLLSDHPVNFSKEKKDKRLRSSILISWDAVSYLIDCGPDFRQQILNKNVKNINGILFTHEHSDHIAGLDDIRPFCYKIGKMPIFAQERVILALEKRYDYIFEKVHRYPGAAQVEEHIIDDTPFHLNGVEVTPINVLHGSLEIFGYRFHDFAYLTDIKYLPSEEESKLANLKVLVVSAIRFEPHPTHFNIEEALEFIKKINPEKAYITHISHVLGFHNEVSQQLPENVFLSYDGLTIEI